MDVSTKKIVRECVSIVLVGATLFCAILAILFRSFGWFTENWDVQVTGVHLTVEPPDSMLIGVASTVIRSTVVEFDTGKAVLKGATHDASYPSGLKTIDIDTVDRKTGNAGTGATYSDAVAGVNYLDFIVYLGSNSASISYEAIIATLDTVEADFSQHPHLRTASMDVYLDDPDDGGTYLGSFCANDFGATKPTLTVIGSAGVLYRNNPIRITMRCYFDGALTGADGKALLRSSQITTDAINFGIRFDLLKTLEPETETDTETETATETES